MTRFSFVFCTRYNLITLRKRKTKRVSKLVTRKNSFILKDKTSLRIVSHAFFELFQARSFFESFREMCEIICIHSICKIIFELPILSQMFMELFFLILPTLFYRFLCSNASFRFSLEGPRIFDFQLSREKSSFPLFALNIKLNLITVSKRDFERGFTLQSLPFRHYS